MKIRLLLAASLCAAIALPAAAQQAQDGTAIAADPPEVRLALPMPVDQNGPQPIGKPSDWVSNADYPPAAWRNREEGEVRYALDVDREGAVTGCRITKSTATPTLEAETCRLLSERARFLPKQDKESRPVGSVYSGRMRWTRREPEFGSGSFEIKVAFTIDPRGAYVNCRVMAQSGEIPADILSSFEKEPCPGQKGLPARDEEGRPEARDVVLTMRVESTPAASGGAQPGN
ncbi:MAG: energy transducer TonB [Erythrobacter sp.]|uniref:energy transducer TonB n=1 Tax=Erythrobacter sp. TaxID=1042 RepID=UPI0025F51830|nr:TonB family protein [Erythrobacter sp.]MCM0000659.1 energy transducer TonB [Erythrobacter sp.]